MNKHNDINHGTSEECRVENRENKVARKTTIQSVNKRALGKRKQDTHLFWYTIRRMIKSVV